MTDLDFTCASCRQLADCQAAYGEPWQDGMGCADWGAAAIKPCPGRLLKIADVVRETSLHRATIYRAIKAGTFPPSRRLGAQRVAWFEADIEAWKQSLGTETAA